MRSPFPILCAALWAGLGATAGQAADIARVQDAAHGCIARLQGPIEPGDTARLRALLAEAAQAPEFRDILIVEPDFPDGTPNIAIYRPLNLCLDSPGGALTEAMALTELVFGRLGTVVPAGATCDSACALVFMAGSHSTETDMGIVASRFLHVDGRLGFHAPSLVVTEGAYDAASVARAYDISVAVSELIFRNMVRYRFAPSLAARMHATPAEAMFHITRVEEAARWGIAILGVDPPTAIDAPVIVNACANLYLSAFDLTDSDPGSWPRGGGRPDEVRRGGEGGFEYTDFGMEGAGTCRVMPQARIGAGEDGDRGWAPAIRDSIWGHGNVGDAIPPVFYGEMLNFMAWPGEAPLAALPRNGRMQEITSAGRCHVFDAFGTLLDENTCVRTRRATPEGGILDRHLWPSGAGTVLENAGGRMRVNGAPGSQWYWMGGDRPRHTLPTCVRSDSTTNVFCFEAVE